MRIGSNEALVAGVQDRQASVMPQANDRTIATEKRDRPVRNIHDTAVCRVIGPDGLETESKPRPMTNLKFSAFSHHELD